LYGWPEEWPNEPKGHFLIICPSWVLKSGEKVSLTQTRRILVEASLVEFIEQLTVEEERTVTVEQITENQRPLIELHKRKKEISDNGKPKPSQ
jgi:hypothetical protein